MENLENLESASLELKELCEADQNDRNNWLAGKEDWEGVAFKDERRLKRVEELYRRGAIKTSEDMFHAALVFQHGSLPEHYEKAMELSKKAMELGNEDGKLLYPKAEDRFLLSIGKPQIWGTQYRGKVSEGMRLAEPFDREAKTDEERREFGINFEKDLEKAKKVFENLPEIKDDSDK